MRRTLRVAFADDELIARKRLHRLLEELDAVEVVGVCENGEQALEAMASTDIDVMLLDIHMPGLSGIEVARQLEADGPHVIYVTAFPDHAVDAFDLGAVDYVLKPVEATRLERALDRAREVLERGLESLPRAPDGKLSVETEAGIEILDIQRITHASFDGQLVTVFSGERTVLSEQSLADLEKRLEPCGFERVHRRHLINVNAIERLETQDTGGFLAHCVGGVSVPVSRQCARQLRRRLLSR